uniref:Guanine nucleotide-binding protein-like 3 homolog n=1 Tax=Angiostrongylus cantonensis TaxID=6313 RepID=A0A0K0D0T3_ANGCA
VIQARADTRKGLVPADLQSLAARAEKESSKSDAVDGFNPLNNKTIKSYAAEVRKMIESADIILQIFEYPSLSLWVLDARDPLGCRSSSVEQQVLSSGKRLVLLLNKIDLVPRENVAKWLTYLRTQMPTIAFKASTQEQNTNISRFPSSNLNNLSSSKCIGADIVMKLLGNYCRNKDIKTSIRVGVVGFPNVGKSSVINSLKRRRACNVGAMPGVTKEIQEIELDKHIRLIDSPGVVLLSAKDLDPVEVALKNAIRIDSLVDYVGPVCAILRRCPKETLMLHYCIPEYHSTDQFLALVARKLGRLKKGARPDTNAAAKHVLNEWNNGRLRYYTHPPEEASSTVSADTAVSAEIVSQFSKEFDIDALDEDLRKLVDGSAVVVSSGRNRKTNNDYSDSDKLSLPTSLEIDGNVQINSIIKKAIKKKKRAAKKQGKPSAIWLSY